MYTGICSGFWNLAAEETRYASRTQRALCVKKLGLFPFTFSFTCPVLPLRTFQAAGLKIPVEKDEVAAEGNSTQIGSRTERNLFPVNSRRERQPPNEAAHQVDSS